MTINGTMRTASGNSDPDVIFGNSFKVGDITLATTGISTASGNITLKSHILTEEYLLLELVVITLQSKVMAYKHYKLTVA